MQRDVRLRRAPPVLRDLPPVRRVRPRRHEVLGSLPLRSPLHHDARLHRPGRGRADPPAGRDAREPPVHAEHERLPRGGRERDGGGVPDRDGQRPHADGRVLHEGDGQSARALVQDQGHEGRVRRPPRGGGGGSRPGHRRDRLRGRSVRRRGQGAGVGALDPDARRVHAVSGGLPRAGRGVQGVGPAGERPDTFRRGEQRVRVAPLQPRADRHDQVRDVGTGERAVREVWLREGQHRIEGAGARGVLQERAGAGSER
mmetsp:Transcript_7775/g.16513  ORF Transcript_7775/g.16513 Transcript_7775/m.16513 type:complete len:257 (+) Transcript_7775:494-1264(+)